MDMVAVQRLIRRIEGFARGLGVNGEALRQIAEGVVGDMPDRLDEERLTEARTRLLLAAA